MKHIAINLVVEFEWHRILLLFHVQGKVTTSLTYPFEVHSIAVQPLNKKIS